MIFASMPKIDSQASSWKGRHFLKALQSPQHRQRQHGHLLAGKRSPATLPLMLKPPNPPTCSRGSRRPELFRNADITQVPLNPRMTAIALPDQLQRSYVAMFHHHQSRHCYLDRRARHGAVDAILLAQSSHRLVGLIRKGAGFF
ncbi:hypothetical protein HFO89_30040 [Rhizobium leguminosarum]|uniref:hypothetical protein n=1 Tax=Rhizobium leguminosarum TaxID=384 RepID=UPI001C963969|nr:hypothetical protein [Rhizobium leguminosarum]MBY5460549.1 hypothetical protein [Rhizobium leguminosarum]